MEIEDSIEEMNKTFQACDNQEDIQNKLKQWSDQENDKSFTQAIISEAEEMRDMARIINERYAADDDNNENDDNNNDDTNTEKICSVTDGNEELQKFHRHLPTWAQRSWSLTPWSCAWAA